MLEPILRFPQFYDEWEEKKMRELCTVNQGLQIAISQRFTQDGENRYFYITNEFLKDNSSVKYYIERPPKTAIATPDDILMTRTGNTGIVITNVNGCFHNNFFRINFNKKELDKYFLYYFLKQDRIRYKILALAGNSTIPDLNHKDFYSLKIKYPCKQEQHKIANLLCNVDKYIIAQELTVKKLEEEKAGLMQRIFSQKIRFKDDSGNEFSGWEEKALGELGEFKTSSVDKLIRENESMVNLLNYMDVYHHKKITASNCNKLMQVSAKSTQILENNLKEGDIVFTPSSETPDDIGHSIVIFEDLPNTLYSYHLIRFRPYKNMFNIDFSHYFCNTQSILNQFAKFSQGATRFTLNLNSFIKVTVLYPTSLKEQEKIADCLSKMDELIENEKQILEQWKLLKKGLLQQMFVSEGKQKLQLALV